MVFSHTGPEVSLLFEIVVEALKEGLGIPSHYLTSREPFDASIPNKEVDTETSAVSVAG